MMRSAKSKRSQIEGKSLPLNAFLTIINLISLYFLVLSVQHGYFPQGSSIFTALIFGLSLFGLFVFKGFLLYAYFAKFLVGCTLLISGFALINDPVGYGAVLKFYFIDGNLNYWIQETLGFQIGSLSHFSTKVHQIAIFLGVFQVVLALSVLFSVAYRLFIWFLFPLMTLSAVVSWQHYSCIKESNLAVAKRFSEEGMVTEKLESMTFDFVIDQRLPCENSERFKDLGAPFLIDYYSDSKYFIPLGIVLLFLTMLLLVTSFYDQIHTTFERTVYATLSLIVILLVAAIYAWFWIAFFTLISFYLVLGIKRFGSVFQNAVVPLSLVSLFLMSLAYYAQTNEPFTDFRPYATGASLPFDNAENHSYPEWVAQFRKKGTNKNQILLPNQLSVSNVLYDEHYEFMGLKALQPSNAQVLAYGGYNPVLSSLNWKEGFNTNKAESEFLDQILVDYYGFYKKSDSTMAGVFRMRSLPKDLPWKDQYFSTRIRDFGQIQSAMPVKEHLRKVKLCAVWVLRAPSKMSPSDWSLLEDMSVDFSKKGLVNAVIISSNSLKFESKLLNLKSLVFLIDQKEINRIFRSNYGLLLISKGVVKAKYMGSRIPSLPTLMHKIQ